jgi:hypothetical protein
MKNKMNPAKEQLIGSLLEDLKENPQIDGVVIGHGGIESTGLFSEKLEESIEQNKPENNDKTALLSEIKKTEPEKPKAPPVIEPAAKPSFQYSQNPFANAKPKPAKPVVSTPLASSAAPILPPTAPPVIPAVVTAAVGPSPGTKTFSNQNRFLRIENAKMAQDRIHELEQELEKFRKENEMLSSSHEISKSKLEELLSKNMQLEKQRNDFRESSESELRIFREALQVKDSEIARLKTKIEELNLRLSGDLRKIRVRERELENRLELSKAEKTALVRSKDETILELKRKQETMMSEIESYQRRIQDLHQKIEMNQEQFARTVRALRLALTNLEVNEDTTTVIPIAKLKKS